MSFTIRSGNTNQPMERVEKYRAVAVRLIPLFLRPFHKPRVIKIMASTIFNYPHSQISGYKAAGVIKLLGHKNMSVRFILFPARDKKLRSPVVQRAREHRAWIRIAPGFSAYSASAAAVHPMSRERGFHGNECNFRRAL